jgi:hypothetical protein
MATSQPDRTPPVTKPGPYEKTRAISYVAIKSSPIKQKGVRLAKPPGQPEEIEKILRPKHRNFHPCTAPVQVVQRNYANPKGKFETRDSRTNETRNNTTLSMAVAAAPGGALATEVEKCCKLANGTPELGRAFLTIGILRPHDIKSIMGGIYAAEGTDLGPLLNGNNINNHKTPTEGSKKMYDNTHNAEQK